LGRKDERNKARVSIFFTRLATKDLTQSEFSRSVLSIVYIKHKKKKKKKKQQQQQQLTG
jgi:hypothetical protein